MARSTPSCMNAAWPNTQPGPTLCAITVCLVPSTSIPVRPCIPIPLYLSLCYPYVIQPIKALANYAPPNLYPTYAPPNLYPTYLRLSDWPSLEHHTLPHSHVFPLVPPHTNLKRFEALPDSLHTRTNALEKPRPHWCCDMPCCV